MSLVFNVAIQHGVRIDRTHLWVLQRILDEGYAGVFEAPDGQEVVFRTDRQCRVAPGLCLGLIAPSRPDEVRLIIETYVPVIRCHEPGVPQTGCSSTGGSV